MVRRLVLFALTLTTLVACAPASALTPSTCADTDLQPTDDATMRRAALATLCLLNAERAAAGLPALAESPLLTRLSQDYSADMVARHYFEHVTPGGTTLFQRFDRAGYDWHLAGENLAWGAVERSTAAAIVDAWMNSAPHRHNILTAGYAEIGLGLALGAPDPQWTQAVTYTTDFGTPPASAAARATLSAHRVSRAHRRSVAHRLHLRRHHCWYHRRGRWYHWHGRWHHLRSRWINLCGHAHGRRS